MKKSPAEIEAAKRQLLFIKCESKEHLHRWIKVFIGLDLPNSTVRDRDDINPSNSNPLDLVWELYSKMMDGNDKDFTQVLAYAARDTFKTIISAIIETLCLFHLGRDVCHLAAIEAQARKSQEYVGSYFRKPILREFLTSKNKRTLEMSRYVNLENGKVISPVQYEVLNEVDKNLYEIKINTIKILVCNINSVNR